MTLGSLTVLVYVILMQAYKLPVGVVGAYCVAALDLCLLFCLSRGHDDCGCWNALLEQRNLEEYTDTCFGVEVCAGALSECMSVLESEILTAIHHIHNGGR